MWNFIARMTGLASEQPPERVRTGRSQAPRRSEIADIEMIGHTAVATITVTSLSGMDGAGRLAELLDEIADTVALDLILDVQNVSDMDSACLGVMVQAGNYMRQTGGQIAVVNADRTVQYLFKLTRLDRVFPICADVMTALKTIERQREARRAG